MEIIVTLYICGLVIFGCFCLKLVYFVVSGRTHFLDYLFSFFKFYSVYTITNADEEARVYMKRNNAVNYLFWSFWLLMVVTFLLWKYIEANQ